jgi:hypothetical protein
MTAHPIMAITRLTITVQDITALGQAITASTKTMGRSTVMAFWASMGEASTGVGVTADLPGADFKVVVFMPVAAASAVALVPSAKVVVAFMVVLVPSAELVVTFMVVLVAFTAAAALTADLAISEW